MTGFIVCTKHEIEALVLYRECPVCLRVQNEAFRRALTDVLHFSEDARSKEVARGILDEHGGPVVYQDLPVEKDGP